MQKRAHSFLPAATRAYDVMVGIVIEIGDIRGPRRELLGDGVVAAVQWSRKDRPAEGQDPGIRCGSIASRRKPIGSSSSLGGWREG